jgi:hypothetical protein
MFTNQFIPRNLPSRFDTFLFKWTPLPKSQHVLVSCLLEINKKSLWITNLSRQGELQVCSYHLSPFQLKPKPNTGAHLGISCRPILYWPGEDILIYCLVNQLHGLHIYRPDLYLLFLTNSRYRILLKFKLPNITNQQTNLGL